MRYQLNPKNRTSVRTEPKLTLHTRQSQLILQEMMCARSKLQEENQYLRDKLQDAEMLIRLLHSKLEEATGGEGCGGGADGGKKTNKNTSFNPAELPSSSSLMGWRQNRKSHASLRKRDAFRNTFPQGKRTFEPPPKPAVNNSNDLKATFASEPRRISKGIGRSEIIHGGDSRALPTKGVGDAPSEYTYESVDSVAQESVDTVVTEEAVNVETSTAALRKNYQSLPEDRPQMRTVIGMLAQTVIDEYSTKPRG